MREELLKGLTKEQIARVKACKNQEEILALAKQEGIELTDEQLEAVSGGMCTHEAICPKCGATAVFAYTDHFYDPHYKCPNCGDVII